MTRLAIIAAALAAVASFLVMDGDARAQGWFGRSYDDSPPRGERVYRERRRVDDDDYFERRTRYYSRDAVARRNAERRGGVRREEAEPRRQPGFFERLFGGGRDEEEDSSWRARADPGAVEVRPKVRRPRRRPPPPPVEAARPPAPAAPGAPAVAGVPPAGDPAGQAAAPPPAPVEPTTFVAVIGDSIADGLAAGLQEGFADAPELQVKRFTKPNAGLVRADYHDFVAEARKAIESGPITYAVFDVGVNDRQPFLDIRREPPLSDEWKKRYAERIDAMLAPFKERKIPIYWVGLAASGNRRATADHIAINAIARERVEAAGGTYVDVWEGFVDEDGVYAEVGPQLDGQIGRLRMDDGVHYSKAGARKLAHYAEQEIRKVFQPKPATPDPAVAAISPEAGPNAAQPPAAEQPRPISSPVMVLTAPRRSQGGALAAATPLPVPARDASASAARVLVNGEAPEADPGRMDDHRWPGAESPKPQPASVESKPVAPATAEAKPEPEQLSAPPSITDPRPMAEQPQH
ncbi:SGNH/GDSL hydrolase family protein [Hansschlegelia zhihuaiae]|uniref:DUF459 domain-containing protein n=1 Tax=Hansschlegelia zhihuaiae TaxID=405005 RepID=A0A4Q0MK99_9HYPH|nr:GDSL-type esterase/lipase family protein [Hansschlegelia zhihuaiae]RXF73426.1 DUF459 domain-containing protein [Hansschlegelia zhihuaiae]